jgi:hypothetical protein
VLTSSIGLFIEIGGWEEVEDGDEKFDGERARWHRWQVEGEPGGVSACDATAEAKEAAKEREEGEIEGTKEVEGIGNGKDALRTLAVDVPRRYRSFCRHAALSRTWRGASEAVHRREKRENQRKPLFFRSPKPSR